MNKKILYIILILTSIIILLLSWQYVRKDNILSTLSTVNILDYKNNVVSINNIRNNYLYLQYVDILRVDDYEILKNVLSNWIDTDLNIIVITSHKEIISNYLNENEMKRIWVCTDYDKLKKKFKKLELYSDFYVLNKKGEINRSGNNSLGYERGVKIYLYQLLLNKKFLISEFIDNNINIKYNDLFIQVSERIIPEESDYYVIGLFNSICNGCLSGSIVNEFNKLSQAKSANIKVIGILNNNFESNEIPGLITQLDINFTLIKANERLCKRWNELIAEYNDIELNNILFLIDKNGNVIKIVDKNCGCYNPFIEYLYTL